MEKKGRVTITGIARAMGISHATVSMALRGDPRIAAATRAKVEEKAKALGYAPSLLARGLKSGRTGLIGVVSDRSSWMLGDRWEGAWLSGIHDAAREAGYRLLLNLPPGGQDRARLSTPIAVEGVAELADGMVDGVVVIGGGSLSKAGLKQLEASGLPLVFAANDVPFAGHSQYLSGHGDRFHRITQQLLEMGHDRIGVAGIAGARDFNAIALEAAGRAFRERGLRFQGAWFRELTTDNRPGMLESWQKACTFWRGKAAATALLLSYGDQGEVLQEACEEQGLTQLDLPLLASLGPFGTMHRRWWSRGLFWDADAKQAGREAMGLLLDRMQGGQPRTKMLHWGPRSFSSFWEKGRVC